MLSVNFKVYSLVSCKQITISNSEFKYPIKCPETLYPSSYPSNKPKNITIKVNDCGETPLHYIVQKAESYNQVIQSLSGYCDITISLMTKITDDNGNIPLQLVNKNLKLSKDTQIKKFLLKHNCDLTIPSLKEKFILSTTYSLYPVNIYSPLEKNLQFGQEIINQTRDRIFKSSTHPETNSLSDAEKLNAWNNVDTVRKKARKNDLSLYVSNYSGFLRALKNQVEDYEKDGWANCQEFAREAMYLAHKKDPDKKLEIIYIANGDHAMLVIDKDPNVSANHFKYYGTKAVIVDAWAKLCIPAKDVAEKLTNYCERYNSRLLCTINPKYHVFKTYVKFPEKPQDTLTFMDSFALLHPALKSKQVDQVTCGSFALPPPALKSNKVDQITCAKSLYKPTTYKPTMLIQKYGLLKSKLLPTQPQKLVSTPKPIWRY